MAGAVIPDEFADGWANMPVQTFSLAGESLVTISSTGIGFAQLTEDAYISLKAGDIIALNQKGGRIAHSEDVSAHQEIVMNEGVNWNSRSVGGDTFLLPDAQNPTSFERQHQLQALVVRPSRLKFTHNFTQGLETFNVTSNVVNGLSSASDTSPVDVQELILWVIFNCSEIDRQGPHTDIMT